MLRSAGIIAAAGNGIRMGSDTPKQFAQVAGKPMLYWSLKAFEDSIIEDVIVVTGKDHIEYVKAEIIKKYGFTKVRKVVAGGEHRYDSVYEGLKACGQIWPCIPDTDYPSGNIVLIHDAARPMVTAELIAKVVAEVVMFRGCALGGNVVDTIRLVDEGSFSTETLDRTRLRTMQTPQGFTYGIVREAYDRFMELDADKSFMTDDVMIVQAITGLSARIADGGRENIKVTTPEDIKLAELFLNSRQ